MNLVVVILLAVGMVALAFLGLAVQILFRKNGKFPNTHVGGNPHLRKQGISCAQTQDRIEQAKIQQQIDYKKIRFTGIDR